MLISALACMTRARLRVLCERSPVQAAADAFAERHVGLIIIADESEAARGVLSKSDLVRHLAAAGRVDAPIAEVMTRNVVFASPTDDLQATWHLMVRRQLQNLPLIGAGRRPVGVLDIRDALEAILRQEERQEDQLINYIAGTGYR
jgi:CBS domain-containing protein